LNKDAKYLGSIND